MDLLPLIPIDHTNHDVDPGLRSNFQTTLTGKTYPKNLAENLSLELKNKDKKNELQIYENALDTFRTYRQFRLELDIVGDAETDLMEQYGNYLIKKDKIDASFELREAIKLKHCNLFQQLNRTYVDKFSLIQKSDLLPDIIRKYLDFRYNKNIPCYSDEKKINSFQHKKEEKKSEPPVKGEDVLQEKKSEKNRLDEKQEITYKSSEEKKAAKLKRDFENEIKNYDICGLSKYIRKKKGIKGETEAKKQFVKLEPSRVFFENCERNKVYKKQVKIHNVSPILQSISIYKLPKLPCFKVDLDSNAKIASGMSTTVTIYYKSAIYKNQEDRVVFATDRGGMVTLPLESFRKPPRLFSCIFKSNMKVFDITQIESQQFYEERQKALNFTIDCGGCFLGQYVLLTIILQNRGNRGSFFIISEQDWFFQDIASISSTLEMFTGDFWIYPTYFEICSGELAEMNIIFQPSIIGTQMENCYIICDNNSLNQIEIIGDAWYFSKSFITIDIPPEDTEIENKVDYVIYYGNVANYASIKLVITVHNTSCAYLPCAWKFQNKPVNDKIYDIKCVRQKTLQEELVPYSSTDYVFEILFNGTISGYYSIFFGFYVLNLPEVCLNENEDFLICDDGNGFDIEYDANKMVDVQITEFEVAAYIDVPPAKKELLSAEPTPPPPQPKLNFYPNFLTFGILPPGVTYEKTFSVVNLTNENIEWYISEIKYNIDKSPYLECVCSGNISDYSGKLEYIFDMKKLTYKVVTMVPQQWVSILILSSNIEPKKIEAVCIVTYEAIHYDIAVKTGYNDNGVLCPLKMMYVGIPCEINFSIENRSHITGCFCLLQPYGKDTDKITAEFDIQSAILKPAESVDITVTLICNEIGMFQNFFVPCFIGMLQEPIDIRILCVVDGLQIYFYLPIEEKKFKKVLWPPRIIFQYEYPCICEHQSCSEMEMSDSFSLKNESQMLTKTILPSTSSDTSAVSSTEFNDRKMNLTHLLSEQFSEQTIAHEHVVEVHQVQIKVPMKVSFYIENITPIKTNFTVGVQNFFSNTEVYEKSQFISPFTKKEEIWTNLVNTKYGILIQPETEQGDIGEHGAVKINLWIFAITYGTYMEDILVDIDGIPCFSFTLIADVVGCPISFPIALNSLAGYPIIRVGNLRYGAESFIRRVKIVNNACIPLTIVWSSFLRILPEVIEEEGNYPALSAFFEMADEKWFGQIGRVDVTDEYVGMNIHGFCQVKPNEISIAESSSKFIDLEIEPTYFEPQREQTDVICTLLGRIFLEQEYKVKSNYYFRQDLNFLKIEVNASIIQPILALDLPNSETKIKVFANDVICKNLELTRVRLLFQNRYTISNDVIVVLEEPLYMKDENGELCQRMSYRIQAQKCLEIIVFCVIDLGLILELADMIYGEEGVRDSFNRKFNVNADEKILKMYKNCFIEESEHIKEAFPIEISIHYPNITVQPNYIHFRNVLIGNTDKTFVTIYNLTGCEVRFEIYRSSLSNIFHVTPHYGVIEKSTGQNKSFVNIFIYFTPKECETYKEAIRIITSVPSYFVDVIFKGESVLNEKFHKDYKI